MTTETPCDGRRLLSTLSAAASWLDGHKASVDALNVFPVPDGDTGGNMSQTLSAAAREAHASPSHAVGEIAERASYGALMGARGNSGVILSQLLRGFSRALKGKKDIAPVDLAAAFTAAAETAGRAVMKPVEGTILTVARDAAAAAAAAAERGDHLVAVLDAALAEARAAVARTPDQLPVLKQAGVVDAGGQGYVLVLEGCSRALHGLSTHVEGTVAAPFGPLHNHLRGAQVDHAEGYGYCTEFVVVGPSLDAMTTRDKIALLGDSLIVVGEEGIVRVHVHTADPGRVLSYAGSLGALHKIKIDNMQTQHDAFVQREDVQPALPNRVATIPAYPVGVVGVVAVAPGEGLAEVFRSLGADRVVSGGQTMNPSTAELLEAIDALPQEQVVLLPNNSNVLLTADQAQRLTKKSVIVVPARTIPQGVAAMLAYKQDGALEENAGVMGEATTTVSTGEVTVAVRDARLDVVSVRVGQALGLLDGEAVVSGPSCEAVALDLLDRMGGAEAEIATIYYGSDVDADAAQQLADAAAVRFPSLEIEMVAGGQPHYPFIMAVDRP